MNEGTIDIKGITPKCKYPSCKDDCKSVCISERLKLPECKPDIKCILQVFTKCCCISKKKICGPKGLILVIEGLQKIKIIYEADERCRNIISYYDVIPFCKCIPLNDCSKHCIKVYCGVQYASVKQLCKKDILVYSVLFVCPIFSNCCYDPCEDYCEDKYDDKCYHIDCDVNVKGYNCYYERSKSKSNSCKDYGSLNKLSKCGFDECDEEHCDCYEKEIDYDFGNCGCGYLDE